MAEYLTNTTDLTAVADAIRVKGGTSAQLVFPAGFVSAIQAIQTGITPKLIVTTAAGAAVTAVKGSKTISGTAGTDGTCTLELPEAGEWRVTAAKDGLSSTQTFVIGTQSMTLLLADPAFSNASWAEIIAACHGGNVPATWAVGDSKTMTIGGTAYQIDIIGKGHDDYADGSGKAPLTLQLHDCYATEYKMNTEYSNAGGWNASKMRTEHLPALLALMPAEVQNGIRAVSKKTSMGSGSSTLETTSDALFLLSEAEALGTTVYSAPGEGTQYDYYKVSSRLVKNRSGAANQWWERSPSASGSSDFCRISESGGAYATYAAYSSGVSFAFCF